LAPRTHIKVSLLPREACDITTKSSSVPQSMPSEDVCAVALELSERFLAHKDVEGNFDLLRWALRNVTSRAPLMSKWAANVMERFDLSQTIMIIELAVERLAAELDSTKGYLESLAAEMIRRRDDIDAMIATLSRVVEDWAKDKGVDDDHVIWTGLNMGIGVIRRLTQSRHNYGLGHLMEQIEKVERLGASLGMIELLQWAIDSNVNLEPQLPEAFTQLVAYEGNIEITMNVLEWVAPRGQVPLSDIRPLVEAMLRHTGSEMGVQTIKTLCWRFRFQPVEPWIHNVLLSWIAKLKEEGNLDKEYENLEWMVFYYPDESRKMWHRAIVDIIERMAFRGNLDQASAVVGWARNFFPDEEVHMFDKVTIDLLEIYKNANNFTEAWALLKGAVECTRWSTSQKSWGVAIREFIQRLEIRGELDQAFRVTEWACKTHSVEDGPWMEQKRLKYKIDKPCAQ
jgi:hypothetical protein